MEETINQILKLLDYKYGKEAICYLNYTKDYELMVATILAAQCTDERVNKVTEKLFIKYNKIEDFAECDIAELEQDVFQTGFYRNKAQNIKRSCGQLITDYSKNMPMDIETLTKLAGVGRKTANVILTHIFKQPSIVVDTHVKRVSYRLGLTKEKDPTKIEFDLMKVLPKENWARYNSQIMALGRTMCKGQKPKCGECFLEEHCGKILV
ncbi:MAG TPA: endonuclease III [Clostridiales bacterium]|nr:MAG: endonuclease III [Clostridiales bacterium GWD2_32_59]HAN10125.1 endonuclease III [Clostridiales bacterium]